MEKPSLADIIDADLRNAIDLDSAIAVGQEAADDEERGRWRIAALVNKLNTDYGRAVVSDFAKSVNRKRSYVYEAGQTWGFYGGGNVLELIESRVVTYSHMRDAMRAYRRLHPKDPDAARDEALQWLDAVANDLMTVEQAALKLKERLGILLTPAIRFAGRVQSVGERYVMFALLEGDDRMDAWFTVGQQVMVSVKLSAGAEKEEATWEMGANQ